MPTARMQIISFYLPIYACNVYVFFGCPRNTFLQYVQKNYDWGPRLLDSGDPSDASTWHLGNLQVVHYEKWSRSLKDQALLIHELTHVALNILHKVGVRISPDSDEAFTYLVQYLYTAVISLLKPVKKRRPHGPLRSKRLPGRSKSHT